MNSLHRHGGYEYEGKWRPHAAWNGVHTCIECMWIASLVDLEIKW